MKRSILICTIVLLAGLFTMQSFAQTVKIKRFAVSTTVLPTLGTAPAGTFQVYGGLRTVGKGQTIYLKADTTGTISSVTWSFLEKPTASTLTDASITSAAGKPTKFAPDAVGRYIVQVDADGKKDQDTFFVSTFLGTFYSRPLNDGSGNIEVGCGVCHKDKYDNWQKTGHAMHFKWGVSGLLESEGGRGSYGPACVKCHTTGWDQTLDNGNFGYVAKQNGFDTLWYKGKDFTKNGSSYLINSGSTYAWSLMQHMDSTGTGAKMEPLASIGCEWCHGPGKDHNGNKTKISKTFESGLCLQCHDAMPHHSIGNAYNASAHAMWPDGEHTAQTGCYPCHSGLAFAKWIDAGKPAQMTTTDIYSTKGVEEGDVALTCTACHDPHGNGNPNQLRTMTTINLRNGFVVDNAGKGAICINCHNSRYDANKRVTDTAPLYGFSNYYGPHGNPQADMFFGQNAYQFDQTFDNYTTHAFMDDACVTCHMQDRDGLPNHEWTMTEEVNGVEKDRVEICQRCHGSSVASFGDIKGQDYDGNGKVEGVKTEIANMMATLKAKLPQKNGEVISAVKDTAGVKLDKRTVGAIYDYFFVKNDGSQGMHNAKYTVALLRAAIASFNPNGVKVKNNEMPKSFNLSQNYPNPFNPTTQIEFSVPNASRVTLNIYNIVGQLVATLVNGEFVPGNYTATWNGRDLSGSMSASGIYLYRIQGIGQNGQNFSMTKKMVLAK
ncbi:MAG TPA: cytochrome c3 family protein [Ignavibacteriales bacterium]|nr:cytochrome c3 family protein [Ignavibacteriales bacterium]